jgi:hypothetical protein
MIRPQHGGLWGDGYWPEPKLYRWLCDSSMTGQAITFPKLSVLANCQAFPVFLFQFARIHAFVIARGGEIETRTSAT